ncbi:MAG: tetratricopeptide repeat protein, partial [Nannocystaceae bacterium]|nr:tetratricopeptide repeat protein [Nannocystaceae bacterium]
TATKAAAAIQPYVKQTDAFVQRVLGIAAIRSEQLDKAEAALGGEDVHSKLYRGWLRLEQDRPQDALKEAQAVLAANTDDRGALCLKLAALAETDLGKAVTNAQAALDAYPTHPGVRAQYVPIMLASGDIAKARAVASAMTLPEGAPPAFDARIKAMQGDVALASGQAKKAAGLYQEALALLPEDLSLSIQRMRALVQARKFSEAEALIVDTLHAHASAPEAHLIKAEIAIAGGEAERAVETLNQVDKALPNDARVAHMLGQVHAMKLEVEDAQKMFATARERDASFIPASVDEARLLAKVKQLDSGINLLDEALKLAQAEGRTNDAADLLVAKATLFLGANKQTEAIAGFGAALEEVSGHNGAQLQRGLVQIAVGKQSAGAADLEAVFARTGGYPGLAGPLGKIYLRSGRVDDLETLIGSNLAGDNTPPDLQMLGARLRLHQDRPADAKALLLQGLALNPSDWEAHMLLSEVYLREHDPAKALASIKKSRPLAPQAELYLQRGRVLEFNDNHDDARPLYYKATLLDPTLHEARWLYGRALETSGQYAGAIEQLAKVVNEDSAKSSSWYPEAWQYLGLAQSRADKQNDAIKSLKQAVALNENLGQAYAELGDLYERDNRHAPAIAALSKATKLATIEDHWYVGALMNLGRAQQKSGKTVQAKSTFKKYLDVAPADASGRAEARRVVGI